jgi:formate dehydrogenase major subunit
VPIEGSEFELKVDYVLAAIGQKTNVNFLEDLNTHLNGNGELKLNRWGDIDADPKTLQTGNPIVFAAGDGVTGPATLIEAIGQARIASRSCHQLLTGQPIEPPKEEFLSKRDNFKTQVAEDYIGKFEKQQREEMPTLDPKDRVNFKEVELGYDGEEVAIHETHRCLECGCTDYFTCDLKKHSTEYGAEQKKYEGEFKEYQVDFRHPFIEIDNNKCILCSRCVRICRDVVGANALGLVNRGFETYVAPSMGDKLQDTHCESCGLCISTCPTGAISENVIFKPGPVKLTAEKTICNYCSIGCELEINHKNGYVMKVTGSEGMVNRDGNLCRFPKFGYNYINDKSRITKPLYKVNGRFQDITFEEAYNLIEEKIKSVKADDNVFFAGARLTNEEMYLIQKLARGGVKTNNVSSFHYLNRGDGYIFDSASNVPFEQLTGASKIYLIGSEINADNAVAGFMVNVAQNKHNIPVELITIHKDSPMRHKTDKVVNIKSYYHFIKAVNYYLVANGFENGLFIKDNTEGFEKYKKELLKENFVELVEKSGVKFMDSIIEFAKEFNNQMNAIIIFSEKEICAQSAFELRNLAMVTGKLGKTSNGVISLKEKNNSQGLFDMGICPKLGVGGQDIFNMDLQANMKEKWGVKRLPKFITDSQYEALEKGILKNLFIFGEDPLGCAQNKVKVAGWLSVAEFVVVQDYFMTKTAEQADLILPASFPVEIGGSFANTQKVIQEFDAVMESKVNKTSLQQLIDLNAKFGMNGVSNAKDVMMEAIGLLPAKAETRLHNFKQTDDSNCNRMFDYGCDNIVKQFEEYFDEALKK